MNPLASTTQILRERAKVHGKFSDHARISQALKHTMYQQAPEKWRELTDMQCEALEMIQHKIARILAGDPDEVDHWDDIAGYAKLPEKYGGLDANTTSV